MVCVCVCVCVCVWEGIYVVCYQFIVMLLFGPHLLAPRIEGVEEESLEYH